MVARKILSLFRTAIIVCALASGVHYLINNSTFKFNVAEIKKLAQKYSGQHPSQAHSQLLTDLRRTYANHVIPTGDPNWFTLGGLQAKLYLIHVSVSEYLAVVGSPGRFSGHIGFHWMNQSCSILTGTLQRWKDGPVLKRENFGPGEHVRFGMFEGSVVDTAEDTWLLCYGRGFVPASSPYLAMNFLVHSVDPLTPMQMLYTGGKSIIHEVLLWIQDTYFFYVHKFLGK